MYLFPHYYPTLFVYLVESHADVHMMKLPTVCDARTAYLFIILSLLRAQPTFFTYSKFYLFIRPSLDLIFILS